MSLSCRFYANEFPAVGDTVVAKVNKIDESGAYVTLSEYNNKEGMIPLLELSRRRIRSAKKLVRVGRSERVVVIRVDKDNGTITLSKRRAYLNDMLQCEDEEQINRNHGTLTNGAWMDEKHYNVLIFKRTY